jgi:hypothetical protein
VVEEGTVRRLVLEIVVVDPENHSAFLGKSRLILRKLVVVVVLEVGGHLEQVSQQ